jgi:MFS family permease
MIFSVFISVGNLVYWCSENNNSSICKPYIMYPFICVLSALCGCGSSIMWLAQSGYMNLICATFTKKRGDYFGTFWGIMQTCQALGSILSWFLLSYFNLKIYFITVSLISIVSCFLFLTLPNVE